MPYLIPAPKTFSTTPNYSSNPFVSGLEFTALSDTTFSIAPGAARALTSDFIIQYPSYSPNQPGFIPVDITTVGLNGCFPNSIASVSIPSGILILSIYLVAASSGYQINYISTSPGIIVCTGNDFLPPGYDSYRRIGFVCIQPAKTILPWAQSGSSMDRVYRLSSQRNTLFNGSSLTYAAVDLTNNNTGPNNGIVPPKNNVEVLIETYVTTTVAGNGAFLSHVNVNGADTWIFNPVVGPKMGVPMRVMAGQNPTTGASVIYYKVQNAGNLFSFDTSGFIDTLGNSLF